VRDSPLRVTARHGLPSDVPVVLANDLGTHGGARAGLSILYHGHALLLWGAPILMS
jgi:hypothetical protein